MLANDPTIQRNLFRIVSGLESNCSSREDLMQEALVHLWKKEQQQPGQCLSWYLQSCRFHLQHFLASGRSVDSPKRRQEQLSISLEANEPDELAEAAIGNEQVLSEVMANEIISLLGRRLGSRGQFILGSLVEGFSTREIAKRLCISHPAVIKHRRKIAALALRFEIARPLTPATPAAIS